MNNPPYILTDVFANIVSLVQADLLLPVLNYQYGYREELVETLKQYSETPTYEQQKFPLIWLAQPFTITSGADENYFGEVDRCIIYIITQTQKNYKAKDRMEFVYKPILYPIKNRLLIQINDSVEISTMGVENIEHSFTDYYFWSDVQELFLNDVVDTIRLEFPRLLLNHNLNCVTFKSF